MTQQDFKNRFEAIARNQAIDETDLLNVFSMLCYLMSDKFRSNNESINGQNAALQYRLTALCDTVDELFNL